MATHVKTLNRAHSPIYRHDTDFSKNPQVEQQELESLKRKQNVRSPFEAGSLQGLTDKILNLKEELEVYERDINKLEMRYRDVEPRFFMADSLATDNEKKRDYPLISGFTSVYHREVVKLSKFPLIAANDGASPEPMTMEAAAYILGGPDIFDDKEDDVSLADKIMAKQLEGKPKFVEMFTFPDLADEDQFTKLPYGISLNRMIEAGVKAQPLIHKKPRYATWLRQYLRTDLSRNILLDVFWWMLIDRFKTQVEKSKGIFYRRLCDNYRLFLENVVPNDRYRDKFMNSFANIISQIVYAIFCHVFADSYSKYGLEFKERLLEVIGSWFQGMRLSRVTWRQWNLDQLEPPGLRLRLEAAEAAAKEESRRKKGMFSLEWIKNLGGGHFNPKSLQDNPSADQQEGEDETPTSKAAAKTAAILRDHEEPELFDVAKEYKPRGSVKLDLGKLDLAGHTPLLADACRAKGTDPTRTGTHMLLQHPELTWQKTDQKRAGKFGIGDLARRKRISAQLMTSKIDKAMKVLNVAEAETTRIWREKDAKLSELLRSRTAVKHQADLIMIEAVPNT